MAEQAGSGFGWLLRLLRAEAGLTQEELARASRISPRTVSDLERGISATARGYTARLLADGLGLTGPRRRAFEAAARGRAAETPDGSEDDEQVGLLASAMRMLPRDIAAFGGRAAELQRLASVAAGAGRGGVVQICAIGGMAGVGKTALSVHAAHLLASRFADGQFFVPLHAHTPGQPPTDPVDALADLLLAAGLPRSQIPAALDARAARWRDYLSGKRTLLVLDDAAGMSRSDRCCPGVPGAWCLSPAGNGWPRSKTPL